ncbi:MAG TPA: DUF3047 domain-containing protein [Burkholderiales bacterium]
MLKFTAAALLASYGLLAVAADLPEGWEALKINDKKKPTAYRWMVEGGAKVLHARAEASASGLQRRAAFSLADRPIISWSWKVSRLVAGADNSRTGREDAPARIVLAFDGDVSKLPRVDQAVMYVSRRMSGQDLPYATLMYIWSNKVAVGSVIENPNSRRIQMVVASSGPAGVGAWQTLSRDVVADYRRAFKEEPGRLLAYGVMSDTDNTGETVEAWYGEISFHPAKPK